MDFRSNQPRNSLNSKTSKVDNIPQMYEAIDPKNFSEKPSCYVKDLEIVDENSDPQKLKDETKRAIVTDI